MSVRLSELPERVKKVLELTPKAIRAKFADARIYLFGSYAKDTWLIDSDIDIIVVSNAFRLLSFPERMNKIRKLLPADAAYEILAYTPAEFDKAVSHSVVVSDAAEYWVEL